MKEVSRARLLIVDDGEAQMRALCLMLEGQGYQVRGFAKSEDALSALRETPSEVLLVDLMMPGMNSIALMNAALEIDPALAVIIMAGDGTIGTAVQAIQSGALDYILKPFKLGAILPMLARAIAIRKLRLDNAALERRVREHAAELEKTNRELEAFTRSAAHDLRSPLHIVLGFSALLVDKLGPSLPEDQRNWLVQVERSAHRMNELIDALMRLSYAGRRELNMEEVDVASLVRSVVSDLRDEQPQQRVRVQIGELPQTVADLPLLRQVFVNLVSNAFKFTRCTEHAEIQIGCERQNNERVFFVKDNGPGFDMTCADRLFDAFQRLHRANDFEGNGVGLSIAQRVVHRHGGRIWARSALKLGASFFFTLNGVGGPSLMAPFAATEQRAHAAATH